MGNRLTLRDGRGGPSTGDAIAGRLSRRSLLTRGLAAWIGGLACNHRAGGQEEADTSAHARDDAIRSLPLTQVTGEARRKLMAVCERPTIYRRLPEQTFSCDAALHLFLVRNPEVTVNIWELLSVAHMTAERQGPYLWKGTDGAGTACDVELVYGTDDMHVIYSDGFYEGSLLKHRVMGRCVLVLKSANQQGRDRRNYVTNRADLFLQLDNTAADVVARTLSPWVGKVADANFHESCVFASKLSQTAEQNSAGVQRLGERLTKVDPAVREEFSRLAGAVQQRAAQRESGGAVRR